MKQISIEIIQKCSNNCLHCSSLASIDCTLKIETEKVKEIIDAAESLNTQILSISGGEPFEHDGLISIVEYAKKKKLKVYIYTSGIVSGPEGSVNSLNIDLLKKLHAVSVDKLIFDLPAINEAIYNAMMGTKGYQPIALRSIKDSAQIGIFTEIHFVPTKLNISEIDNVIKFVKEESVDQVSFIRLVLHGRAVKNIDILQLSETEELVLKEKLKDIAKTNRIRIGIPLQIEGKEHCYAGKEKLCIRYDGKVFGCESFKYIVLKDENGEIIEPDSIYERKVDEIFLSSKYLEYGSKFIKKQMKECECNEKCPMQRMFVKHNASSGK